jgi:hypothetical protein
MSKIFIFTKSTKVSQNDTIVQLGAPIAIFEHVFRSQKISKKIFWNTDQVLRSVVHFFKGAKLCQNEAKPNSKKYGESPWFFLYSPVGERGTLTVRSFEIQRGPTWPKPKINLCEKIANLNEILSFWSKIWDFDQLFAKKNSSRIPIRLQIGIPFFQKDKTASKQSHTSLKKIWLDSIIFSLQV